MFKLFLVHLLNFIPSPPLCNCLHYAHKCVHSDSVVHSRCLWQKREKKTHTFIQHLLCDKNFKHVMPINPQLLRGSVIFSILLVQLKKLKLGSIMDSALYIEVDIPQIETSFHVFRLYCILKNILYHFQLSQNPLNIPNLSRRPTLFPFNTCRNLKMTCNVLSTTKT